MEIPIESRYMLFDSLSLQSLHMSAIDDLLTDSFEKIVIISIFNRKC